ncbi:hypothetical protein Cfor_06392 [Coptotermes formosanus]|uniref:Ionotropic glutamate receptor C-terminal domain-containing protein n=1 Tax=Coptotermes formosanus TaxID=36987 RepID=A0A6L2PVL0_COPFO|nr:hypothetical protein Cfor_06392 [Coptotermes formosanus]
MGRTVLVSMPSDEQPTVRSLSHPRYDNTALVTLTLTKLHDTVSWPLRLFPPEITLHAGVETTHSYIIFTWSESEDTDIIENLKTQVETLKVAEGGSWNPGGKFLVVVADNDGVSPRELGLQIYVELWKQHFIIDCTILIAVRHKYLPINSTNYTHGLKKDTLDLYTGVPYQSGKCEDVTEVTLLDQWHLRNGTFIHNANLFPLKTTDNFHGCQIRVASFGIPPYLVLTGNSTDSDGKAVYELSGLAVRNLLLAVDKMDATVVYLKPSVGFTVENNLFEAGNLADGRSDIVIATLPLVPLFLSTWFQPTTPYEYTAVKRYVPCPKSVSRMEKIMMTYKLPVWLTMATLFVLTTELWWCLANWQHSALKDSQAFQTLSYCLYNAWAVSRGISATNVLNTWKFRFLFLVYVCYCFAMSTVFQAFFISFLVEPGYGKKFETFDELLDSSVVYGYDDLMEYGMASTSCGEHNKFPSSRRQDCNDIIECMERIANNAQMCTISVPRVSEYLATKTGIKDNSKHLCTLEENLLTTGFIFVLVNGSPFLNRLNVLTRRSQEGGLLGRYWAQLIWITKLRSKMRIVDNINDLYFVFSLSHLSPAFCVLAFGYVISSAVFFC